MTNNSFIQQFQQAAFSPGVCKPYSQSTSHGLRLVFGSNYCCCSKTKAWSILKWVVRSFIPFENDFHCPCSLAPLPKKYGWMCIKLSVGWCWLQSLKITHPSCRLSLWFPHWTIDAVSSPMRPPGDLVNCGYWHQLWSLWKGNPLCWWLAHITHHDVIDTIDFGNSTPVWFYDIFISRTAWLIRYNVLCLAVDPLYEYILCKGLFLRGTLLAFVPTKCPQHKYKMPLTMKGKCTSSCPHTSHICHRQWKETFAKYDVKVWQPTAILISR